MSFVSAGFLFGFLPLVLIGFHAIRGASAARWRGHWLLLASAGFYLWSGWSDVLVLLASLTFNSLIARRLVELSRGSAGKPTSAAARRWLAVAVSVNLALLFAYKAAAAKSGGAGFLGGADILIPLGLSFITFQQIAFLLDCSRGRIGEFSSRDYVLFIAFFPQLVMGPIVHFRQLVPQFQAGQLDRRCMQNVVVGLSIFAVGLFKKLVVADSLADPVGRVFAQVGTGSPVATIDAWGAAIGFQLQLYMDFSGYADMAIGLARMFNLDLPLNYDNPFHATNRFDLWRRWHLTFVEFMRTHVFQPLARISWMPMWGALAITGMASGLWHGLGWTFVLWGLVQTLLLLLSHVWGRLRRSGWMRRIPRVVPLQIAITFACTALVGVLFRAPEISVAADMYAGMFATDRLALPWALQRIAAGLGLPLPAPDQNSMLVLQVSDLASFILGALVVWVIPQTRTLFSDFWTAPDPRPAGHRCTDAPTWRQLKFKPSLGWGALIGVLLALSLSFMGDSTRFIYFQF